MYIINFWRQELLLILSILFKFQLYEINIHVLVDSFISIYGNIVKFIITCCKEATERLNTSFKKLIVETLFVNYRI